MGSGDGNNTHYLRWLNRAGWGKKAKVDEVASGCKESNIG